jgi:hypothetical protein
MPVYTVVITVADGRQHTSLSDFSDDKTAIGDLGEFVSLEHPSAAVGRGAGSDVEFLGVWDWSAEGARWTAEE